MDLIQQKSAARYFSYLVPARVIYTGLMVAFGGLRIRTSAASDANACRLRGR